MTNILSLGIDLPRFPALISAILLLTSLPILAADAFHPGQLWPDTDGTHINAHGGGILFHNNIWYWFGEHKIAGKAGNFAHVGVSCYSSSDLYHWKNLGTALAVSDDPHSDITKGCIIERPKVIYNAKTGKFVMWFHLELKGKGYSAARSGVAVADQPQGPYRYLHSLRPNAGVWPLNAPDELKKPLTPQEEIHLRTLHLTGGHVQNFPRDLLFRRDFANGQMARDMTLFVDDDSLAYHIYASEDNGTLQISRLADDYLQPAGQYIRLLPGEFNEAPALFKRAGKYFLITSDCTGWKPNDARLAVADSILGPWTSLANPCQGPHSQNTFSSQGTFILPLSGNRFIFMADRWNPQDAIDGRHIWLPIEFQNDRPLLRWRDQWDLSAFK